MRKLSGRSLLPSRFVEICWYITAAVAWAALLRSIPGYWLWYIQRPMLMNFTGIPFSILVVSGVVSLLSSIVSLSLGTFLFFRKRGDRFALYVSLYLLLFGIIISGPFELIEYMLSQQSALYFVKAQLAFFVTPGIILLLTFPNGVISPSRFRWLIPISIIISVAYFLLPPAELLPIISLRMKLMYGMFNVVIILGLTAQFYRYFRLSTPIERQQTKIVVFGLGIQFILMSISSLNYMQQPRPPNISPLVSNLLLGLLWTIAIMIFPIVITLAVIRSHLWEIDVIIRRTLIYGFLTAALAFVYFGSVIVFQYIFRLIAGHESSLAVVISTLGIAGLFTPLRRSIQAVIDRRFFRNKYNTEKALVRFQESLRDRTELDQVEKELTGIVQATVQPEWMFFSVSRPKGK